MDASLWREHRGANRRQSWLLIGGMLALLAAIGWAAAGVTGLTLALVVGLGIGTLSPGISPKLILKMYRARPIDARRAPGLVQLVEELARRAGLARAPTLYYVPAKMINAFAVGDERDSAVAVTVGMLQTLNDRELAGVMAHEVSHIAHDDVRIMGLADMFSRLTATLSGIGKLLLFFSLLFAIFTDFTVNWLGIALLIFAPMASALLQLALSRTREYDADLGAAALTGDPEGLASALARLEQHHARLLDHVLVPGRKVPDPSVLRTHPPTKERIERLLALKGRPSLPSVPAPVTSPEPLGGRDAWALTAGASRRAHLGARALGLWY